MCLSSNVNSCTRLTLVGAEGDGGQQLALVETKRHAAVVRGLLEVCSGFGVYMLGVGFVETKRHAVVVSGLFGVCGFYFRVLWFIC